MHTIQHGSIRAKSGTFARLSEYVHSLATEAADMADIRQPLLTRSLALGGRSLPDTEESRVKGEKQLLGDVYEHLDPTIPQSRIPELFYFNKPMSSPFQFKYV